MISSNFLSGLVIVYDLTRPETLQDAERWLDRTAYRPLVPSAGGGIIPYKFLVGTKLHLLVILQLILHYITI